MANDRELPSVWKKEGTVGTKQVCLQRIEEVWTDVRPLSLRRTLEEETVAEKNGR